METKRLAAALTIAIVACAIGAVYFKMWIGPGTSGPENEAPVAPMKTWIGPGTGGPEVAEPVRYLIMPAMGGPE